MTDVMGAARESLRRFFGYKEFRPAQEPVIKSLMDGHDTLAVMPTGAGKSVCFQIPALLSPGLTVVLSPLISLMKDQVDALVGQGIPASFINSSLDFSEVNERMCEALNGRTKILYVAPERLEGAFFAEFLAQASVSMVIVDEAHCISEWGHDFRPSYRMISPFIEKLPKRPVLGAFTATATPSVKDDISHHLAMLSPNVFVSGFDRPNLSFDVFRMRPRAKNEFLIDYVRRHAKDPGIIYASTRKAVEAVFDMLYAKNIPAGRYHAGLSDEERTAMQEDFLYDRRMVMVATNAFGMGIDKSNVRYVIHYNMPKNIEAYYQEAGRAGRDGEPGECILLYSEGDVETQKYLINTSVEDDARKSAERHRLQNMVNYCHTPGCLRAFILRYFGEKDPVHCDNCGNCRGEVTLADHSIDAQKVLSCVYRMRSGFGATMVSDVLRGRVTPAVSRYGFDSLSTFGLMKDKSRAELKLLMNQLVSAGYLEVAEGDYPILRLTAASRQVLRGEVRVMLPTQKKILAHLREDTKEKTPASDGLFGALREVRKKLAARDHIPPFMVFSDATLRDMCSLSPQNLDEMREVRGVGERKLRQYGQEFLDAIAAYDG